MMTRNRILPLPGSLEKGDVVRDFGIERTVTRTETSPSVLADLVIVHFDPIPDRPDLPPSLAVPASQRITAWRTLMGKKNDDQPQQSQAYTDDIAYRARVEAVKAASEGDADTARGLLDYAQTVEAQRAQQQKNG